jgi:hypothetical protein
MMALEIQIRTPASSARILMEMIPGPGHGGGGMGPKNSGADIHTATVE